MALLGGKSGLTINVGASLAPFKRKMAALKGVVKGLGASLASPFKMGALAAGGLAVAIGAVTTALGVASVKAAAKFQTAFTEVLTIMDKVRWSINKAATDLIALSVKTGARLGDVTRGLYQVISAGFTGQAEAFNVLNAAVTAARGGFTTVETAVKGISKVLHAYNLTAWDAAMVSDKLFRLVELGMITFEEGAKVVGRFSTFAAKLGISMDEAFAAFGMLSKVTTGPEEASTQLRALFKALLRPTDDAIKAMERFGVSIETLKLYGLGAFLEELNLRLGDNEEAWKKIFPELEGYAALLEIGGEKIDQFVALTGEMTASTGAAKRAEEERLKSLGGQWDRFTASIEASFTTIGKELLPWLSAAFGAFADTVQMRLFSGPDSVVEIVGKTSKDIEASGKAAGTALGEGFADIVKELVTVMKDLGEWMTTNGPQLAEDIRTIAGAFGLLVDVLEALKTAWNAAKSVIAGSESIDWSKYPGPIREDYLKKGYNPYKGGFWQNGMFWQYQHGGLVGGRGGRDAVGAMLTRGEYVMPVEQTGMFLPLLEAMRAMQPTPAMAGTDQSTLNLHLNFSDRVDRNTVRRIIVPEVQRAWEIGSLKRSRGIR